jgi:hypothetical protein
MGMKTKAIFWLRQFPFVYPARIISSCQEWITTRRKQKGIYYSQRGPWFKTIFPEGFIQNNEPQTLGKPNEKAFYYNRIYPTPIANLFYLQNSYLFGHKGLVLTVKHEVFQEFSHHFGIATLKKFLLKNPFYLYTKSAKKITGVGAVLVSPESQNYYHWLNDVLPRIRLYEEVIGQVDHFCVASNVPQKFLDILTGFGIPSKKILLVEDKDKLHFDHLYVSSLPGSEGRSPQWAIEYTRDKLIKTHGAAKTTKKIYLKRGNSTDRKILNEDAIISTLKNNGFEIIEPGNLSIHQQVSLVQQAKIVVSAHGAALTNLLFSPDNLMVVELFSPDYFRTDCYYTLSAMLKLNYWYIVGERPAGANWGDMIVDEKLLKKTLQQFNG